MELHLLIILIPILGLLSWTYARVHKKIDHLQTHMDDEFRDVKKSLHSLDMRLTRLEGRFDGRGYWESRKTGTKVIDIDDR